MRMTNSLVGLIVLLYAASLTATTVNGRFVIISTDSLKLKVLLQISSNTGYDDLGGSTIVIAYDSTVIGFRSNPQRDVDYLFHNFCSINYNTATVTKPLGNRLWINIDLPPNNNNNGTVVLGPPSWTDIATLTFDIINPNGTVNLSWVTTSIFWEIYDADNFTLWNLGEFENYLNFPLPVELTSFTASVINNKVKLNWQTAIETNNYGFEIERRTSPQSHPSKGGDDEVGGGWTKIGFVNGHGNSNSPKNYSFSDESTIAGKSSYRLKQIDNDGTFEYSKIVEVDLGLPIIYELTQNYPNPFNPTTTIRFQLPETGFVNLKVYNLLGQEVRTLVDETKEPGVHTINFNAEGINSGIYIYKLEANGFTQIKKMTLIK